MKASKMAVSALSALAMVMVAGSAMADAEAAPITVAGGTVNFTAEITDAACVVSVNSSDQNVALGNAKPSDIVKGKTINDTGFTITLEKCAVDTYADASFDFGGQSAEGDAKALANTAGTGAAAGVGVQLKDIDSAVITINAATGNGAKMKLAPDTNIASFSAGLYGLASDATSGHVVATTNFSVHYE